MKYSVNYLKSVARNYKTRSEFKKRDNTLYEYVRRHKLLDVVCEHMGDKRQKWTVQSVTEASAPYKYLIDFINSKQNAYKAAKRLGILSGLKLKRRENVRNSRV